MKLGMKRRARKNRKNCFKFQCKDNSVVINSANKQWVCNHESISHRIKSAMFTRGKYRNMLLIVKFLVQLFFPHLLPFFFFGINNEFSSCNTRNYNKSTPRTFIEVIRRRKGEFSCLLLKLFPSFSRYNKLTNSWLFDGGKIYVCKVFCSTMKFVKKKKKKKEVENKLM